LRWEWTAHQQVVNIEFYVQCADIRIISNAGPTKPNPVVAISGIEHLPPSASSYRNPYNGQFGDEWLVGPEIASFSLCNAASSGCIGGEVWTGTTTVLISTAIASSSFASTAGRSSTSVAATSITAIATTTTITSDSSIATKTTSRATTSTIRTTDPGTTVGSSCDRSCVDSLEVAVCREADIIWNMCSVDSPWWISRCQATCAKCVHDSPPCGQCDHRCADTRSECYNLNQMSAGALCSGGWGVWWQNQCKASCGACDGRLPLCSQAVQLNSFSISLPTDPSRNSENSSEGTPQAGSDNNTVLIIFGILNGVLILCLFFACYMLAKSKLVKSFTV